MKALALMVVLAVSCQALGQTPEVVVEIRVHGNVATPDDEIRRLAGVEVGTPMMASTIPEVVERLRATNRFRHVEVLKRFASIADPSRIVLVVVVDEGAVKIEMTGDRASPTRIVKRRWPRLLFFPILGAEDGYGVSYGMRFALADRLGANSRVSFPLTWGGEKKAGAEFDKAFTKGPLHRLTGGAAATRRTNPFFDLDDGRRTIWIRAERQLAPALRIGAEAGREHVTFGNTSERFTHTGIDITLDTRIDPVLPRNAIDIRAGIERLTFSGSKSANQTEIDARGYVGLFGQTVLAVRALRDASDRPLPPYAKALLGGMANLRGFHAGTAAGDTLVAGSIELLLPLSSPLSIGRFGVSAFVDGGAVYDRGERFADQVLGRGVGGSVWLSAALLRLSVAVAHGIGATTRVHFGGSVLF